MPRVRSLPLFPLALLLLWAGCQSPSPPSDESTAPDAPPGRYATVRLDADVGALSDDRKQMISLFVEAAQAMDAVFWEQAYGNRDSLLQSIADPQRRRYAALNYGPWDRLRGGQPFVDGAGPRPPGANFYPSGLTAEALRRAARTQDALDAPDTMVRRLPDGSLTALPYHLFFAEALTTASGRLQEAARLAPTDAQRASLERRAKALMTGEDAPAAEAPTPPVGEVTPLIGSIPTGEDRLLGVKASATAVVLRRDSARNQRLARIEGRMPALWDALPVPDSLRPPPPTYDATAYDALYVAGGLNAGPKASALPLPAARRAPSAPAVRSLLLPNALRARADSLLRPLAGAVLAPDLRSRVTADALFDLTALRQVARRALPDTASALRGAGAAGALSLALAGPLAGRDDTGPDSLDYYATGLAHLAHTLRVDSTAAAGRAARASLRYLVDEGALSRPADADRYAVAPAAMAQALPGLVRAWLQEDAATFAGRHATIPPALRSGLARLEETGVPLALAFEQGPSVLRGLAPTTAAR